VQVFVHLQAVDQGRRQATQDQGDDADAAPAAAQELADAVGPVRSQRRHGPAFAAGLEVFQHLVGGNVALAGVGLNAFFQGWRPGPGPACRAVPWPAGRGSERRCLGRRGRSGHQNQGLALGHGQRHSGAK